MKSTVIYATDEPAGWIPWGALAPFLCVVFVIAGIATGSVPLDHLHLLDANSDPVGTNGVVAFTLLPFSLLGLIVLAWVRWGERRSLASIGLIEKDRVARFARGHLIGAAAVSGVVATSWLAGAFTATGWFPAWSSPRAIVAIMVLLATFALQSSVEEVLFRGWLLSVLARKFNRATGTIVSSLVFTLLHFDPGQATLVTLNVFLFAFFAACWSLSARNIWGVMGFHAGWNWLLAVGFHVRVTGLDAGVPALLVNLNAIGPAWLTGGSQGPEGSLSCTAVLAVGIAGLLWRWRKLGSRERS